MEKNFCIPFSFFLVLYYKKLLLLLLALLHIYINRGVSGRAYGFWQQEWIIDKRNWTGKKKKRKKTKRDTYLSLLFGMM